jgi:2-polyprenyl-6-methoxyphenol hydroxylase-like FAD-dependent oxidoreductase
MTSTSLDIAIVGGGIGGLAAAVLLTQDGHRVRVFEQASRFARVGAGIQMTPNAMKVLRRIGAEPALRKIAFQSPAGISREWDSGKITNELTIGAEIEERFGAPYLFMHRADLHAAILAALPPGIAELNRKLVGVETSSRGATLAFDNGEVVTADVVIGADGVHSLIREAMLGPEQPRYTGRVAYRTTFPAALMGSERITPVRTKWWGPDRHMVVYYVTANQDEVYFVTSQPEDAGWVTPESWSAKGDLNVLREAYAGFHPEVQAVLRACPEVHKWALLARDPLPHWVESNVALLGDACHPMTPYMAQGAASALEDAAVLSRCLNDVGAAGINAALRRYEATRKPRATQIQGNSSKNNWMREATDPTWVYGYDAWSTPLLDPAN